MFFEKKKKIVSLLSTGIPKDVIFSFFQHSNFLPISPPLQRLFPFVLLTLACCLLRHCPISICFYPHLSSLSPSFYHQSLSCDVNTYSAFHIKNPLDLMSHFCNYCGFLPQLMCNSCISIYVFHLPTNFDQLSIRSFCSL